MNPDPNSPYQPDYGTPPPPPAGLNDAQAGGIAYLTIIPAILFLILSPYNRRPFVRFHCFQCIFLAVASICLNFLHIIPILGSIVAILLGLVIMVLWLISLIFAFQGKKFMIPLLSPLAEQAAASTAV